MTSVIGGMHWEVFAVRFDVSDVRRLRQKLKHRWDKQQNKIVL